MMMEEQDFKRLIPEINKWVSVRLSNLAPVKPPPEQCVPGVPVMDDLKMTQFELFNLRFSIEVFYQPRLVVVLRKDGQVFAEVNLNDIGQLGSMTLVGPYHDTATLQLLKAIFALVIEELQVDQDAAFAPMLSFFYLWRYSRPNVTWSQTFEGIPAIELREMGVRKKVFRCRYNMIQGEKTYLVLLQLHPGQDFEDKPFLAFFEEEGMEHLKAAACYFLDDDPSKATHPRIWPSIDGGKLNPGHNQVGSVNVGFLLFLAQLLGVSTTKIIAPEGGASLSSEDRVPLPKQALLDRLGCDQDEMATEECLWPSIEADYSQDYDLLLDELKEGFQQQQQPDDVPREVALSGALLHAESYLVPGTETLRYVRKVRTSARLEPMVFEIRKMANAFLVESKTAIEMTKGLPVKPRLELITDGSENLLNKIPLTVRVSNFVRFWNMAGDLDYPNGHFFEAAKDISRNIENGSLPCFNMERAFMETIFKTSRINNPYVSLRDLREWKLALQTQGHAQPELALFYCIPGVLYEATSTHRVKQTGQVYNITRRKKYFQLLVKDDIKIQVIIKYELPWNQGKSLLDIELSCMGTGSAITTPALRFPDVMNVGKGPSQYFSKGSLTRSICDFMTLQGKPIPVLSNGKQGTTLILILADLFGLQETHLIDAAMLNEVCGELYILNLRTALGKGSMYESFGYAPDLSDQDSDYTKAYPLILEFIRSNKTLTDLAKQWEDATGDKTLQKQLCSQFSKAKDALNPEIMEYIMTKDPSLRGKLDDQYDPDTELLMNVIYRRKMSSASDLKASVRQWSPRRSTTTH